MVKLNESDRIGPLSSCYLAGLDTGNEGLCGFAVDVSNGVANGEWDTPQAVPYLNRYWMKHVRALAGH